MIWCRFSKDGETSFGRVQDERGLTVFRSEEHTSELQSRSDLVCRLLLEKKKKKTKRTQTTKATKTDDTTTKELHRSAREQTRSATDGCSEEPRRAHTRQ